MAQPQLWQIPYSPWSERARWALDAAGVEYQSMGYQPMLGERALKRLRGDGKASVPVLALADRAIGDSAAIAEWAAQTPGGVHLLPKGVDVTQYDDLIERGLAAGRVISLSKVLKDPKALCEMVPKSMRSIPWLPAQIAAFGVRRTLAKYGSEATAVDTARAELATVLDRLREELAKAPPGSPRTLTGQFSLLDIGFAQVLVFIHPPTTGIRVGHASRACFHDAALSEHYADLVQWRDELYAAYRSRV